jgi:hypothetical protein
MPVDHRKGPDASRVHVGGIVWTWALALSITCSTSLGAGARQPVPSQTTGAVVALPANLTVAPVFQSFLDSMWRSSPTFRRQCSRLVAAEGLSVALRLEELQRRPSFDARTVFVRRGGVLVAAHVFLSRSPAAPELIAHEVEHVLEQLDGVDLAAHVGSGNVWQRADGAFETRRAAEVGQRVAREMRLALDASKGAR